ncbi:MAG: phosphotransferase [Chloroflexia bacterium]
MLEKPDLPDEKLVSCLRNGYGLEIVQVAFLPLGADVNTAVYRAAGEDGTPYFVKLRGGVFDELTVAMPRFLRDQGIEQIITPVETLAGQLWTQVEGFTVSLYPFVEGRNGFEVQMPDRHWQELGAALKGIHTAVLPWALRERVPQETYGPHWRDMVRTFQASAEEMAYDDPIAAEVAAFLRSRRGIISDLVGRAEELGKELRERSLKCVLCHGDIHAGNVLIGADGSLYIVDWDTLILAPKERDLMFIGAGIGGVWKNAHEEVKFYEGYGHAEVDAMALAYYRYERIVEDIAAFCGQLLLSDEGGEDRQEALRYLVGSFLPNHVVDIAYALDKT